jgi:hypothetical protein
MSESETPEQDKSTNKAPDFDVVYWLQTRPMPVLAAIAILMQIALKTPLVCERLSDAYMTCSIVAAIATFVYVMCLLICGMGNLSYLICWTDYFPHMHRWLIRNRRTACLIASAMCATFLFGGPVPSIVRSIVVLAVATLMLTPGIASPLDETPAVPPSRLEAEKAVAVRVLISFTVHLVICAMIMYGFAS